MNILNKLKSNATCLALCLAGSWFLLGSGTARAEVELIESNGWTFSFDGRINSFISGGKGDDFPLASPGDPDPNVPHLVMGGASSGQGIPDVGWRSSVQADASNKYSAVRIRSGMFGNVLGFALTRRVSETTTIRGYFSLWSTIETLGRDKWAPVVGEAREGFFQATGTWGTATIGRTLGWVGRFSYMMDVEYGHGYGLGLPCTDALGPACGHVGTGALFPGYSAGAAYSTPSLGGLQISVGVYDPVVFNAGLAQDWSHATLPRTEGAVTFDRALGSSARVKAGVEGLYQQISRVGTAAGATTASNIKDAIWGVSGGARLEVGPARVGVSAFTGKGIGILTTAQRTSATSDNDPSHAAATGLTYDLRTSKGVYGQGALVAGPWQLGAGYGIAIVDQLAVDKINPNLSVIHSQTGISGSVYYRASDSVVIGLDYFRFMASWYGAPVVAGGVATGKLVGEKQSLNFINAGATYRW